jgi:hypothetical protein
MLKAAVFGDVTPCNLVDGVPDYIVSHRRKSQSIHRCENPKPHVLLEWILRDWLILFRLELRLRQQIMLLTPGFIHLWATEPNIVTVVTWERLHTTQHNASHYALMVSFCDPILHVLHAYITRKTDVGMLIRTGCILTELHDCTYI